MGLSLVTGATLRRDPAARRGFGPAGGHEQRISYGRVRLWGSITFIVAAIGVGGALQQSGPEIVLVLLLVTRE